MNSFIDGKVLKEYDLGSDTFLTGTDEVDYTQVMADKNILYCGTHLGSIIFYDPRMFRSGLKRAHNRRISCLVKSQKNGYAFYSGSHDHSVKQWDLRKSDKAIMTMCAVDRPEYANFNISNIYESKSGDKLFVTDMNLLYMWNIVSGDPQLLRVTTIDEHIYENCIAMDQHEEELYVQLWNGSKHILTTISSGCGFDDMVDNEK